MLMFHIKNFFKYIKLIIRRAVNSLNPHKMIFKIKHRHRHFMSTTCIYYRTFDNKRFPWHATFPWYRTLFYENELFHRYGTFLWYGTFPQYETFPLNMELFQDNNILLCYGPFQWHETFFFFYVELFHGTELWK